MKKMCYVCGKQPKTGHTVSHSNRKTKRTWKPNLQASRIMEGKTKKRVWLCTKCLKLGKIRKAN